MAKKLLIRILLALAAVVRRISRRLGSPGTGPFLAGA
jgi:hypothetical protein